MQSNPPHQIHWIYMSSIVSVPRRWHIEASAIHLFNSLQRQAGRMWLQRMPSSTSSRDRLERPGVSPQSSADVYRRHDVMTSRQTARAVRSARKAHTHTHTQTHKHIHVGCGNNSKKGGTEWMRNVITHQDAAKHESTNWKLHSPDKALLTTEDALDRLPNL